MSVYRQQNTQMSDADCLKESLEEMKFRGTEKVTPEVHAEKQNLEGYHGDKREQKAEIIIRRKQVGGASNDIGFERGEDGNFVAHISAYDQGYYNSKWLSELKGKYALKHGRKIARKNGYTILGTTQRNGKTVLRMSVKA
jgi:hypothetical protein